MLRARVLMVIAFVVIGTLSIPALSGTTNITPGLRANETIHTDKSIYVVGETVTIYIHGDATTLYDIYVNGHYYHTIRTNNTGDYVDFISTYNWRVKLGTNTIELRDYWSSDILASTQIEVRQGLEFWPSKYTHTTTSYLSGELLWVKLTGENNKEYRINITDKNGNVVYPKMGNNISVTTNSNGEVIFNVTLDMGDGQYSMNLYNGTNYIQSKDFDITSVEISAQIDKSVYLLSEKIHGFVTIYWLKTHTPLKNATYRWWIINSSNPNEQYGPYFEEKSSFYTYPLDVYVNATGKKIGVDQEYILRIEYNMTNSTGLHYGTKDIYFYTGHLGASISCDAIDGSFSPDKRVRTTISTYVYSNTYYGYWSSLGNVTVEYLNISAKDHWEVLWSHNYTSLGKTDLTGNLNVIWTIPDLEIGTMIVVTAKVSVGSETYVAHDSFYIQSGASSSIKLDKEPFDWTWYGSKVVYEYRYLAGDTVGIKVIAKTPSNVRITNYEYSIYSGDRLLYYASTDKSEINYHIPLNYSGELYVEETTYFSTGEKYSDMAIIYVYYGSIYLQPSQYYFKNPGDRINIYIEFQSNVMHPQNYTVSIMDDHGREILKTTIPYKQTTNYTFIVPNEDSDLYTVEVETMDGYYYTSNSIIIERFVGYEVHASIITKSKFENGIYEPGQTIKISYSIYKYGTFNSHNLVLYWSIVGTDYTWSERINQLNGTITLTIPTDIHGSRVIEIWVEDSEEHYVMPDMIGIDVEKGSWSMQSIAGMPMGTFLNLILVVIALILVAFALFMLFRGGREGYEKRRRAPQPFEAPTQRIGGEGGEETQPERTEISAEKPVEGELPETEMEGEFEQS